MKLDSTFTRALLGFVILTTALSGMALVALWAIDVYAGNTWWVAGLVILVALAAEVGIYSSTLHEPIYSWIREPKVEATYTHSAAKAVEEHEAKYHKG